MTSKIHVTNSLIDGECARHVEKMLEDGARESGQFNAPTSEVDVAFLAFMGEANRFQNIVGVLTYDLLQEEDPPIFYAGVLYVLPKHRRRGVGRKLLKYAAICAEATNCTRFELTVKKSNHDMWQLVRDADLGLDQKSFKLVCRIADD